MTGYRIVYAGRHRLQIPIGWSTFTFGKAGLRYRINGAGVEYQTKAGAWRPSLKLMTSSPAVQKREQV